MDNKPLVATLGIAAVGLASLFFYFEKNYNSQSIETPYTVELARQIVQEIKYQMLIVCVNFADKMNEELIKMIPKNQMQMAILKLKKNLMQMYQQKEEITLNKHALSKQDFEQILQTFQGDEFVGNCRQEIKTMMELAAEGKYPDISIPAEALSINNKDRIRQIYQNVCQTVISAVRNKLIELSQKDPNFDCKNDEHYKLAVRQINVYRLRAEQLMNEGYRPEWGCPNEVFFKVMQNHKREDIDFKMQITAIQKGYNHILQVVSNNPFTIEDESIIHIIMQEEIVANLEKEQEKHQRNKELEKQKGEDLASQANYFFQKGKMIEKELKQSKAKMTLAKSSLRNKEEDKLIL